MSDELDEIIQEFIVESHESMDELDQELIMLEQEATADSLARIFRAIHTVKGTSGFLGFSELESVAHVGENLLSKLRDGIIDVDQEITTALLTMLDTVRGILRSIETTGTEGTDSHDELIDVLRRLEQRDVRADPEVTDDAEVATEAGDEIIHDGEPDTEPDTDTDTDTDTDDATSTPATVVDDGGVTGGVTGGDNDVNALEAPSPAVAVSDDQTPATADERTPAAESIRVDVGLLDDLMNLVGELVLARNQILQHASPDRDAAFIATTQRLNLITTELQEGVMRTRMQPIENVWNKFPRVVRDLSLACGKQAALAMEGKHTELDKTLLESIKDPLTHLVRNSVDHGLESPEVRRSCGKNEEGTVRLRAYHEGGQVIVEISDDGAGIDPAVMRRKAVEKGVWSADEVASRTDREILDVIFQPGFSTAEAVTNISGRGVGMDVVRTNIEGIGGSVDVQSTVGVGTSFKIKIPLTLAIIPALVVACDEERFAIPQVSLLELVRIDRHDPHTSIETVNGVPVYRLRGRLLPIVYLREVFGGDPPDPSDGVNIVVLQADDREFGLVVDEISDTAEIVVKPLGRILKQVPEFAGATIMGDGKVALILDVLGIAESIGMGASGGRNLPNDHPADEGTTSGDTERILMFRLGARRLGLQLATVARLEEFGPDLLEVAGNQRVVQYRDEILNLVFLAEELGLESTHVDGEPIHVVVCKAGDQDVGLVVDDIFDIVEEAISVDGPPPAPGILASTIIHGSVTDVVDVHGVIRQAIPVLGQEKAA